MSDVAPNPAMAMPDHLLQPGEAALWWDRPNLRVFARHEIIKAAICLGVAALSLLAWWKLPQLAPYRTYVFILVGIGAAIGGAALVDVVKSSLAFGGTAYLMTDRRLIVSRGGNVKAMPITDAKRLETFRWWMGLVM